MITIVLADGRNLIFEDKEQVQLVGRDNGGRIYRHRTFAMRVERDDWIVVPGEKLDLGHVESVQGCVNKG